VGFDRTPDRVLIVHDPATAGPSKLPLAIPGAEVVEARSFSRYQEELSKSDFDVVVIDYDLPGTQRPEVLAELKVRDNEPDVLLLSTCTDTDTIRRISRRAVGRVNRPSGARHAPYPQA
jgi:DNA-binding response OmpR family regulator